LTLSSEETRAFTGEVASLARYIVLSWMVVGDFNDILLVLEKVGGSSRYEEMY